MPSGTLTYTYCVVQSSRQPELRAMASESAKGLPRTGALRLLDVGEKRWLVVADAPAEHYNGEAIDHGLRDVKWVADCALAHEAVVEQFLEYDAVIPMKLFTLFQNDRRALTHLKRAQESLSRVFARVLGCHEWGLRVFFNEQRAQRTQRAQEAEEARAGRGVSTQAASGRAFLLQKKQQQDNSAQQGMQARARVDEILLTVSRNTTEVCRSPLLASSDTGERNLLNVAFLVPVAQTVDFCHGVEREAARWQSEGYTLALTGPWSPYHFVDLDSAR